MSKKRSRPRHAGHGEHAAGRAASQVGSRAGCPRHQPARRHGPAQAALGDDSRASGVRGDGRVVEHHAVRRDARRSGSRSGPGGQQPAVAHAAFVEHDHCDVARQAKVLQAVVAHEHVDVGMGRQQGAGRSHPVASRPPRARRLRRCISSGSSPTSRGLACARDEPHVGALPAVAARHDAGRAARGAAAGRRARWWWASCRRRPRSGCRRRRPGTGRRSARSDPRAGRPAGAPRPATR